MVGQAGLTLAASLNEDARIDHLELAHSAGTLGAVTDWHSKFSEARGRLGDVLGVEYAQDKIADAVDQLYANLPFSPDELDLSRSQTQELILGQVDDDVRALVERTREWTMEGEPVAITHDTYLSMYVPLPERPYLVRNAGLALFRHLADDSWIPDGDYWPPPDAGPTAAPS